LRNPQFAGRISQGLSGKTFAGVALTTILRHKMLYIALLRTTTYGTSSNLMEVTVAEVLPERLLTKTHR
jgi:hypothetical protein